MTDFNETIRARLCRDFGDTRGADDQAQAVFQWHELKDIWERVSGAADDWQQHRAALALMFEQTLNSAVKLHDYAAGETRESLDQVYKHLADRYAAYLPDLAAATRTAKARVAVASLRPRRREGRETPSA